ncbi:sugar phosphate isomerase/epimerase family protein [Algoriphagus sp. oki45]|uniref:sugar phosphate isomerase/epimerase family protein n=1 Tax=Algoriphagus sp. oki45 TaxID=3067294 RepID=UPI0030C71CE2
MKKTPITFHSTSSRREFLQKSAMAGALLVWPFPAIPESLKGVSMGVVVHSYGMRYGGKIPSERYPGFKDALDLMRHCHSLGAAGIQTTVGGWAEDFAKKVREEREKLGMYLEGSISLPKDEADLVRFEKEIVLAKEAGAQVLRTVCLSGRRYENFKSEEEWEAFKERSVQSIQRAEPMVKKHQVKLAIENHKDWQAAELAQLIQQTGSEWVGVTLDFGNNISLVEDPMEVIRTLAPFAFSTHVKDMGVKSYEKGFLLSEVELGKGIIDLKEGVDLCKRYNTQVTFSLEMITRDPLEIPCLEEEFWITFPDEKAKQLAKILTMVRDRSFEGALLGVSGLSGEERLALEEKHVVSCLNYAGKELS